MTAIVAQDPATAGIVLGVDDAAENLFLLQAFIEAADYRFVSARSGSECLALLERILPGVILLDVTMPGMNGFETCRRIRALPDGRHVPIVFLSGRRADDDVAKGLAAGGNDFITKPFDSAKLLSCVRQWNGRRVAATAD